MNSNHCSQFVAVGDTFDVDGYLAATNLVASHVLHRESSPHGNAGFIVNILPRHSNLDDEEKQCLDYLHDNYAALFQLRSWTGLESVFLRIAVDLQAARHVIECSLILPDSLLKLTADLGIGIGYGVGFTFPRRTRKRKSE